MFASTQDLADATWTIPTSVFGQSSMPRSASRVRRADFPVRTALIADAVWS